MVSKIREISVEIKALRPYMQHRRPESQAENEKMHEIVKILQKNQFDPQAQKDEADMGIYKLKDGKTYIPFSQIQESMVQASKTFKVAGQGKKTYKDIVKSTVFSKEDKIPMVGGDYEVDSRYVKVQMNGILRNRPVFSNWSAKFSLLITDATLPLNTIKEILETAGTTKGIGDYRPRYGIFEVTKFEEIKK